MNKKDYFIIFALIGLSIVYVILSFLVFITRGKWGKVFHQKLAISATIVAFCAILNTGAPVYAQEADPTPASVPIYATLEPTAVPTSPPVVLYAVPALNVSFDPAAQVVDTNDHFTTDLTVNTMGFRCGMYEFTIDFDQTLIDLDTESGKDGVGDGTDGFIAEVTVVEPGKILISGIHETSYACCNDLNLCTIYWTSGSNEGSTILDLTINQLAAETGDQIGIPTDIDGSVRVSSILLGDVNGDGSIDIVDALLVAQYYVGIIPSDFIEEAADVNASGAIDIVDALMIAQKYVGLRDSFQEE